MNTRLPESVGCTTTCSAMERVANRRQLSAIGLWAALFTFSTTAALGQVTISSSYTQDFNSIGTGLPAGWEVWTSSTNSGDGVAFTWITTPTANNASYSASSAFRNLPGSSQTWAAGLSAGIDRAIGWRAGSTASRQGSITFKLSNTIGYALTNLRFELFTPNSAGTVAPIELKYQIGADTAFTSFSPAVTYQSNVAQQPLIVTVFSLDASELSPFSDLAEPITFSFRNTFGSGATAFNTVALDNFSLTATAVPEPASYALIGGVIAFFAAILARMIRGREHRLH